MPYIKKERREEIDFMFDLDGPATSGELNYVFTQVINDYLLQHGLRYDTINDVIGALEGAKLEFYRRVAAPYEDKKRNENGEVYADY